MIYWLVSFIPLSDVTAVPADAATVAALALTVFDCRGLVRSGFLAVAYDSFIPDNHFWTRNPGQLLLDIRL